MPPGPSPGHINMETDCGLRDGHRLKNGENPPQTRTLADPGGERKGDMKADGWGRRQKRPQVGRMEGQTGTHAGTVAREPDTARETAREIQTWPERRASRPTVGTAAPRTEPYKTPAAALIRQFFIFSQICLFPAPPPQLRDRVSEIGCSNAA